MKKRIKKLAYFPLIIILFSVPFIPLIIYQHKKNDANLEVISCAVLSTARAIQSNDIVIKKFRTTIFKDQIIASPGDIIVEEGGKIILRDTKIIFNHTGFYEHGIILKKDTVMEIYDSQIIGLGNLFFFRAYDATVIVENSTFWRTHAICYNSTNIVIRQSHLWALHCLNDTKVEAKDADLNYLLLMGNSVAHIDESQMIEIILYDRSHVSVSNTQLRFIFYFDEGTATINNCTYEDDIRFEPKLCDLTIQVLDENTLEPVSAINTKLNRSKDAKVYSSVTVDNGTVSFSDIEEGDYLIELEGDFYSTKNFRISVLNETQQETLFVKRLNVEVKKSSNQRNPLYQILIPLIISIIIIAMILGVIFRRTLLIWH